MFVITPFVKIRKNTTNEIYCHQNKKEDETDKSSLITRRICFKVEDQKAQNEINNVDSASHIRRFVQERKNHNHVKIHSKAQTTFHFLLFTFY